MSFVRCGVFFWYWETTLRMVCWSTSGTDFGLPDFVETVLLVEAEVVVAAGAVVVVVAGVWTGTAMLAGLGALADFFGAIDACCLGSWWLYCFRGRWPSSCCLSWGLLVLKWALL